MSMTQKIFFLITGLVIVLGGLWIGGRDSQTVETLIQNAASRQLERPVAIKIDLRNSADDWTFLCGTVTEADGTALKMAGDAGQAPYESDTFCALARAQDTDSLVEFDFGATDMPAMDWLDRHDISPQILMNTNR